MAAFPGVNPFRNGSISRDSVPLWKERDDTSAFVRPVDRGRTITLHRNGSVFRDSVPVWKEAAGCGPLRDVCDAGERGGRLPQRQHFLGFGAVVERAQKHSRRNAYGRGRSVADTGR